MMLSLTTDLVAVILLHYASFHGFGATVTAIVRTAFVVVIVVAVTIALVINCSAGGGRLAEVVRVDTLALQKTKFACAHGLCDAVCAPCPRIPFARA